MLPFQYTRLVKRPTESYLLHGWVGYDLLVCCIAFGISNTSSPAVLAVLPLYMIAFISSYEIGYYENDSQAALKEASPQVSDRFVEFGHRFSPFVAWQWAAAAALVGAAVQTLLEVPSVFVPQGLPFLTEMFAHFGLVMALLIAVRVVFHVFNRLPTSQRTTPMLILQLARVLGYALLFPLSFAGALLCFSHSIARWVPYVVYRSDGERSKVRSHLIALLMFVCVTGISFIFAGVNFAGELWQLAVVAVYLTARAVFNSRSHRKVPSPSAPPAHSGAPV